MIYLVDCMLTAKDTEALFARQLERPVSPQAASDALARCANAEGARKCCLGQRKTQVVVIESPGIHERAPDPR